MINYEFLQNYWWFLIALLGGLLVFLLFVQGGNALIFLAGKTEDQRQLIINSTGRKWELTFTTLVTFGGAFFASFPLFYSTSFGGAYWVWILILITFVFQAVSYEFQGKAGNLLGKNAFRVFLMLNGCLAPLLIGTAVGTFFTGSAFVVNKNAVADLSAPVISRWASDWGGLEAVAHPFNVSFGLMVTLLTIILGALYLLNNIDHFIHTHYSSDIHVQDIADYCKCSRSYISHIFKKNMNRSIPVYINEVRISQAKRMLLHENSITKVCEACGFSNPSYFSSVFGKCVGMSPSQYRATLCETQLPEK